MPLQQFLLRFNDAGGNPEDLQIQKGADQGYRLSVHDKGYSVPTHSEITNVAINETETVYSEVFSTESFITQFYLNGNTDGIFTIRRNGSIIARKKTWYMFQDVLYYLHKPIYFAIGDTILIDVKNTGVQTADYEVIVYKDV